jgi:hypothetical protein
VVVKGTRYHPKKIVHPLDTEAWKKFVEFYQSKAGKEDSVAIAITTDGFNPFGMTNAMYNCWPVYVIPMNYPWPLHELTEHVPFANNSRA